MKYLFLTNEAKDAKGRSIGFDGYQPGQPLRLAYVGELFGEKNVAAACEELFRIFNIGHPSDYHGRSMSVGDVIVLDPNDALGRVCFACAPFGFERIEAPIAAGVR